MSRSEDSQWYHRPVHTFITFLNVNNPHSKYLDHVLSLNNTLLGRLLYNIQELMTDKTDLNYQNSGSSFVTSLDSSSHVHSLYLIRTVWWRYNAHPTICNLSILTITSEALLKQISIFVIYCNHLNNCSTSKSSSLAVDTDY